MHSGLNGCSKRHRNLDPEIIVTMGGTCTQWCSRAEEMKGGWIEKTNVPDGFIN
jgi:hypothetical protein